MVASRYRERLMKVTIAAPGDSRDLDRSDAKTVMTLNRRTSAGYTILTYVITPRDALPTQVTQSSVRVHGRANAVKQFRAMVDSLLDDV